MVLHNLLVSFRRLFHEGAQFPMAVRLFAVRLENYHKARRWDGGAKGVQEGLINS
jgi:hypothetical protein